MEFHRRRKIDASIDMTPMIDTLLQLFLVFLLTATFAASAVPLKLPRASAEQAPAADAIVVSLDATRQLFVNQEPIGPSELLGRLHASWQKDKERRIVLRADRALPYEKVLEVLQTIQRAGATQVDLAYEVGRQP